MEGVESKRGNTIIPDEGLLLDPFQWFQSADPSQRSLQRKKERASSRTRLLFQGKIGSIGPSEKAIPGAVIITAAAVFCWYSASVHVTSANDDDRLPAQGSRCNSRNRSPPSPSRSMCSSSVSSGCPVWQ
ncbi:hypothetical protein SKAU_G00107490 [Synaphobranchus kaupii]|uniref:Uncharacterized protein n=1 Tax=Synaphobranchus kaupii TaxID=118154 RepID=A0A9Q1FZU0_SYNKA|nr:hypothetical protein SKAU_G00107490 [Synaphobranchus kaupii]